MFVKEALSMFLKPVLVVDDMPFFTKIAEDCLRREYVEITIANSGNEAISLAKNHKYDLILMDLYMPNGDGDLACTEIKRDSKNKLTPIIIMTVSTNDSDIARCKQAGCDDFIQKPFDRNVLVEKVKNLTNLPKWSGDRYRLKSTVRFSDNKNNNFTGELMDISIGGILIETNYLISVGTIINVDFKFGEMNTTIKAIGRVAWHNTKNNQKKGNFVGMGVEFTDIKKLDLLAIQSWINNSYDS